MSKATSGVILLLIVIAGAAVWYFASDSPKPPPATLPTSAPATLPVTQPATAPVKVIRNLVDVVLETDPQFPSTQPLVIPGDLSDGARLIVKQPVYLDARKDLWITHPDADPVATVLARAKDEQLHLTRENVRFVHYWIDAKDKSQTALIVENTPGNFEWVTDKHRLPLSFEIAPVFASALSWQDKIIAPASNGLFTISSDQVSFQKISDKSDRVLFAVESQGILAWSPPTKTSPGSDGAFRYSDGKWTQLNADKNWPTKILHLIPLLDGSVLVLKNDSDGNAGVALMTLDGASENPTTQSATSVDEARIAELIENLSNKDSVIREQAFAELSRYGPGAYAIFEKLKTKQPAGARLRIDDLLSARLTQSLGTLRLEAGPLEVVNRFDDGGAIYFSDAGVTVFSENVGPQLITPAYIVVRPGRAVRLLPERLVSDYAKDAQKLIAFADEWFITDEITGPQRFVGNHFQKIIRKREREFWMFKGIDARGRWLFTNSERSATLILDPTLPSPTPKLPVWEYPVRKGEVGWTSEGWPAVKRPGAWVLIENGWRPLDETKERFITEAPTWDEPTTAPATGPATQPSSQPSTQSTTSPTTLPSAPMILREKDGTRWFDGADHLIAVKTDGTTIDWELPGVAVGAGKVRLFRVDDKRLLLFNQTGRILSLRQTTGGKEPFTIDAVFTDKIPDTDAAKRIWQDPAGRVLIAIDDTLWILFPTGKIPEALENMMPPGSMSEED